MPGPHPGNQAAGRQHGLYVLCSIHILIAHYIPSFFFFCFFFLGWGFFLFVQQASGGDLCYLLSFCLFCYLDTLYLYVYPDISSRRHSIPLKDLTIIGTCSRELYWEFT